MEQNFVSLENFTDFVYYDTGKKLLNVVFEINLYFNKDHRS